MKTMVTRQEYLKTVLKSHHLCARELLKIVVPGRWQSEPMFESICQRFGHKRLMLPEFTIEELFPGFERTQVNISYLPKGTWSTPVTDQVALAKFANLLRPGNLLEVGSFRGYTARLLAENTPAECVVHTLDIVPDHGEAYINTPLEGRIKRHFGSLQNSIPDSLIGQQFDFIFLDADHKQEAVESDTKSLLPMLAAGGAMFWHDYADWGWISEWNRVPEVLSGLSKQFPILSIAGTALAVYRKGWDYQEVSCAVESWKKSVNQSQWETPLIRGSSL